MKECGAAGLNGPGNGNAVEQAAEAVVDASQERFGQSLSGDAALIVAADNRDGFGRALGDDEGEIKVLETADGNADNRGAHLTAENQIAGDDAIVAAEGCVVAAGAL